MKDVVSEVLIARVCDYYLSNTVAIASRNDTEKRRAVRMRNNKPPALADVARHFGFSIRKARKILITGGVYQSNRAEEIMAYYQRGMSMAEIMAATGYSKAVVDSFIPYEKCVYKKEIRTANAERIRRFRERRAAAERLKESDTGEVDGAKTS